MNEENGFVLKPEAYSQNEWYQMFLSILKECKKTQQENEQLKNRIDKALKEIEKYLLTEDYCSLKCKNLADIFYELSEILKSKR